MDILSTYFILILIFNFTGKCYLSLSFTQSFKSNLLTKFFQNLTQVTFQKMEVNCANEINILKGNATYRVISLQNIKDRYVCVTISTSTILQKYSCIYDVLEFTKNFNFDKYIFVFKFINILNGKIDDPTLFLLNYNKLNKSSEIYTLIDPKIKFEKQLIASYSFQNLKNVGLFKKEDYEFYNDTCEMKKIRSTCKTNKYKYFLKIDSLSKAKRGKCSLIELNIFDFFEICDYFENTTKTNFLQQHFLIIIIITVFVIAFFIFAFLIPFIGYYYYTKNKPHVSIISHKSATMTDKEKY
jgi:hypothetical protein